MTRVKKNYNHSKESMKQIGAVVCAETGYPITMDVAVSESGNSVPLFLISGRKECRDCFIERGTDGSTSEGGLQEITLYCTWDVP